MSFLDVPSVPECSKNTPFNRVAIGWAFEPVGINAKFLEHLGTLELLLVSCFRTKAVKTSSDAAKNAAEL